VEATKDKTATILNDYLKGVYMGIHSYEPFIQNVKAPEVKRAFQDIQQSHKKHAADVAERIQNLGGTPVDGPGFMATIETTLKNWAGTPEETTQAIKEAIKGEEMGIQQSEKLLQQDLDDRSRSIVEQIRKSAHNHIQQLQKHLV
jgi:bacterioferritin